MDYVPPVGKNIYSKHTANLSTGGTSEDVTDLIHPEVVSLAERVARIIGLDICGIDFISEDIGLPLKSGKGVIIEVNAAPGFRMHTHPVKGKPRNVGKAVIDMMFPGKAGRIPLIAVTGTNGKTTTTRLIAHIARAAGYHAGFTTSDGIYIGNELIQEGDCTGYFRAQKVLRDKSVNFAVLECARGGLLRSGLAFDQCDVGIVTNVAEDHLGLNGINTLEEMARVKSVIPETVKSSGVAVLNAEDPLTCAMKDHLKCRVALFSTQLSSCVLDHCRKGGIAAIYKDRRILLVKGNTIFLNESIYSIPLSFGGKALFMIENILAAVLGAYFTGIDLEIISKALHSFVPSFDNLPGRMNLYRIKDFRFLLDYAHNFHGITALGTLLKKENFASKLGIITSPGDRRNIDLINVGKASADIFDEIIIRVDQDTRGRTDTEIIDLLLSGIRSVNKDLPVEVIKSEIEAIEHALLNAKQGSIIVHFSDKINQCDEVIRKYIRMENLQKEKVLKDSGKL
jgi:cyanophycin synthetase